MVALREEDSSFCEQKEAKKLYSMACSAKFGVERCGPFAAHRMMKEGEPARQSPPPAPPAQARGERRFFL